MGHFQVVVERVRGGLPAAGKLRLIGWRTSGGPGAGAPGDGFRGHGIPFLDQVPQEAALGGPG
ncbi:hypothetical protein CRV15_30455 (plasmid) [Streptomyces clavuligerus]|nr:hypothetical protein SSCG_01898 [Streptomyces clavuligerus]QCS09916.1 hypothetical protein CRV15_30455 [Streptomyces clavuligerus]QPJ98038.1 hypothetical protein GE265_33975 [Streptomyces clavuligerus]